MGLGFLCTRVQKPNEDDYKMLTRVMQFIQCIKELTLTIEPGDEANWWVDCSYTVQPDMQSHISIIMTLGTGAMHSASCKQKINTNFHRRQN